MNTLRTYPEDKVIVERKKLGPIKFIRITAPSLKDTHRRLGEILRPQINKILSKKIWGSTQEQLLNEVRLTKKIRGHLERKTVNPLINSRIRRGLEEYLDCLSAWSEGAQLDRKYHQVIHQVKFDGPPISNLDLGLWLQMDTTGCQTGMLRLKEGSVILWHTEEEIVPGLIDKPRIVTFKTNCQECYAFVYPSLLPGSAFSWSKNFFLAADFLYLKQNPKIGECLANVASWLTWRLIGRVESEIIIKSLGPFFDGYALNFVKISNGQIAGKKIEFAGKEILTSVLSNQANCFLFQINMISRQDSFLARTYQQFPKDKPDLKERLEKRRERTLIMIELMKTLERKITPVKILKMLASREGEEYAYANTDVKAHLVAKISRNKMKIWLGPGPALPNEKPVNISVG